MGTHRDKRQAMAHRIEQETDRSIAEWATLAERSGPGGFMELVAWLKQEHGLGHFQARLIAEVRRDGEL